MQDLTINPDQTPQSKRIKCPERFLKTAGGRPSKEHRISDPKVTLSVWWGWQKKKPPEIKRVHEENGGMETWGQTGKEQEKGKIKEERGERKYCLSCCALRPPFATFPLFVQMPHSLLCEAQGLRLMCILVWYFQRHHSCSLLLEVDHFYVIHRGKVYMFGSTFHL